MSVCGDAQGSPASLRSAALTPLPPLLRPPQFGNGTLRLTTRQAYQLHGVLKQDLKTVFSSVIKNMGSTLGACGDVNRNVMGPAAPYKNNTAYTHAQDLANDIADLLAPQSGAYYDVWLDGEKFASAYKEVSRGRGVCCIIPRMCGVMMADVWLVMWLIIPCGWLACVAGWQMKAVACSG